MNYISQVNLLKRISMVTSVLDYAYQIAFTDIVNINIMLEIYFQSLYYNINGFYIQYETKEQLYEHMTECDVILYDITEDPDQIDEAVWAVSGKSHRSLMVFKFLRWHHHLCNRLEVTTGNTCSSVNDFVFDTW